MAGRHIITFILLIIALLIFFLPLATISEPLLRSQHHPTSSTLPRSSQIRSTVLLLHPNFAAALILQTFIDAPRV